VHNLFFVYLFLVYLSISTCLGRLCAHHQEKQLCLRDTWYCYSVWMTVWYAGYLRTRQSSTQNNKYQVSHKHRCFSWWWAHSRPIHVEIDKYTKNKYTKNKLCTNLALFTRLKIINLTYPLSQKEQRCSIFVGRSWLGNDVWVGNALRPRL